VPRRETEEVISDSPRRIRVAAATGSVIGERGNARFSYRLSDISRRH